MAETATTARGVLIAHPGTGPFVRMTVEALEQGDLLQRFATTLTDDPHDLLQRFARRASAGLRRLLARRPLPQVPRRRIVTRARGEVWRSVAARLSRSGVFADRVWDSTTHRFDRWAADLIDADTQAVYGYEYNCLALFERASALGLPRILEIPSAEHDGVAALLEREIAREPALETAYTRHVRRLRPARTARRRAELALATMVLVNSTHTLASFQRAGIDIQQFRVVPLGAPSANAVPAAPPPDPRGLRLVWAGSFSPMKGAHLLLQALRSTPILPVASIDVYGEMALPPSWSQHLPAALRTQGRVAQDRLFSAFARADLLVAPTLSDGWGMVISEAMAHGLPVLTTTAAGAATLIDDRRSGLLVEPGDPDALAAALRWAAAHPDALRDMRAAAAAAARERSWASYRADVVRLVSEHLDHWRPRETAA